ncbi:MAG: hypothetical protein JWN73_4380 [Betaproteobacteria bacterium]|nr:hypothetical protein [Betaproteobacteria bacterium]
MQASIAVETRATETSAKRALALHRAAAELRERRCHARLRQIALAQYELVEQDFAQTLPAQSALTPALPALIAPTPGKPAAVTPAPVALAQRAPALPQIIYDPLTQETLIDEDLLQTLLIAGAQAPGLARAR